MSDITIPYFEDEESKLRAELPVVERNAINAIVLNPVTNEVLCLDWEKFNWKTFIIGGIENGEDPVAAATREIKEETGYSNIRYVAEIGKTRSGYYAAHKKENRISNAVGLLFELVSDEKNAVNETDTAHHVFTWIPKDKVSSYINLASQKYIWQKALERLGKIY